MRLRARRDGHVRATTATNPAPRKTHTISDSVHAVTSAATANRIHRSTSRPRVRRRQLHRAAGDDRDDGGADPVERALHPGQPAEAQVRRGQDQHHHEGRQDEREADERRRRPRRPAPIPGTSRAGRPRGPGASCARASPSRYSAGVNHRRSSTRSRCMNPTSAMGPPKPVVPRPQEIARELGERAGHRLPRVTRLRAPRAARRPRPPPSRRRPPPRPRPGAPSPWSRRS